MLYAIHGGYITVSGPSEYHHSLSSRIPNQRIFLKRDDAIDNSDDDDNSISSFEEDFLDGHFDEIDEAAVGHIEYTAEEEAEQSGQASDLQNNIASLVCMGVIESFFVNLLMNRHELLTAGNIDILEKHVKDLLK